MNVMEIYRSLQGEGTLMGVPTTFVRFFACNHLRALFRLQPALLLV